MGATIYVINAFCCFLFFFNDTATTEIYTLSLHDALPIYLRLDADRRPRIADAGGRRPDRAARARSEEHTSELQSPDHLVCRLLLEKKKKLLTPVPPFPGTFPLAKTANRCRKTTHSHTLSH